MSISSCVAPFGKRNGLPEDTAACLRTVPARMDTMASSGMPGLESSATSMVRGLQRAVALLARIGEAVALKHS